MNAFLIELGVRSLIIACVGLGLRFALSRFSAQARAKVLTITMVALTILPIAMVMLPKVPVTVGKVQVDLPMTALNNEVAVPAPTSVNLWTVAWLSVVGIFAIRVLVSLARFRKIEKGLSLASEPVTVRVKSLTSRAKSVFYSPEGEPPMTWGVVNPKIALPTESETWIEPEFRSVVLHEDAHIRRRDWAVSIGFRFIVSLYWFNPCVWLLQAYFEQDSERAADDFVLAQGFDAPEYAERLLEVAQKLRPSAGRLPAVTMARTNRLNGRLRAILSSRTPREPMKGWKKVSVLSVLACGALAGGFVLPVIERLPALNTRSVASSVEADSTTDKPLVLAENDQIDQRDSSEDFSAEGIESNEAPTSLVMNWATNANPNPSKVEAQPEPRASVGATGTFAGTANTRFEETSTTHAVARGNSSADDEGDEDFTEPEDPEDAEVNVGMSHQEADRIHESAMADVRRETDRAMADARREIDRANREAQREIEQARKETQKEVRKAMEECKKAGVDMKGLDVNVGEITMGAMKFGEEMAKSMGKIAANLDCDDDKSKSGSKSAMSDKGTKGAKGRTKSKNANIKIGKEAPKETKSP